MPTLPTDLEARSRYVPATVHDYRPPPRPIGEELIVSDAKRRILEHLRDAPQRHATLDALVRACPQATSDQVSVALRALRATGVVVHLQQGRGLHTPGVWGLPGSTYVREEPPPPPPAPAPVAKPRRPEHVETRAPVPARAPAPPPPAAPSAGGAVIVDVERKVGALRRLNGFLRQRNDPALSGMVRALDEIAADLERLGGDKGG